MKQNNKFNAEDKSATNKTNSNKNYRGRKNNGKGKGDRKSSKRSSEESVDKNDPNNINDSSYYYTDNTVLDQLQNYSFNQFGGVAVDFPVNSSNVPGTETIPMISCHYVNPSIPQTDIVNGQIGRAHV